MNVSLFGQVMMAILQARMFSPAYPSLGPTTCNLAGWTLALEAGLDPSTQHVDEFSILGQPQPGHPASYDGKAALLYPKAAALLSRGDAQMEPLIYEVLFSDRLPDRATRQLLERMRQLSPSAWSTLLLHLLPLWQAEIGPAQRGAPWPAEMEPLQAHLHAVLT